MPEGPEDEGYVLEDEKRLMTLAPDTEVANGPPAELEADRDVAAGALVEADSMLEPLLDAP